VSFGSSITLTVSSHRKCQGTGNIYYGSARCYFVLRRNLKGGSYCQCNASDRENCLRGSSVGGTARATHNKWEQLWQKQKPVIRQRQIIAKRIGRGKVPVPRSLFTPSRLLRETMARKWLRNAGARVRRYKPTARGTCALKAACDWSKSLHRLQ
jgi:hypothetical protein